MAIVKTKDYKNYKSAVTLEHYASLIGYSECAIYGVFNQATHIESDCRDIWTLDQRNYILRYFSEAQEELENETARLFSPTWVTGNLRDTGNDRLTDIQNCAVTYYTKWNNLIQMGRKVVTNLELDAVVNHLTDPALVGPIPVNTAIVTDFNFVKVFYPDTEIEINPSNIFLVGTDLYIEIPRCRMVEFSLRDNSTSGVNYADVLNFQATVDVVYWSTNDLNSIVEFGNGSAGLWYLSGEIVPTVQQKDLIIRLAHSKMPEQPCGCEDAIRLWSRDRNIPEILTAERLSCDFGISDGAWIAWKWAQSMKKHRFGYI